jgi:hypothetical protein
VDRDDDLQAAKVLYAVASEAALGVLRLYIRKRRLFDQIAPHRNLLPSLFSIHPNTVRITGQMLRDSRLGTQTDHARQAGSLAFFVSDSPVNIYARAIIASVRFNQQLESVSSQQASWKEFDRKERVQTIVLPFPKFVAGLDQLPVPISSSSVTTYWRKGKEIIQEEMPDFHLRPEWKHYCARRYKGGAKPGAIRHAIFKDILAALKTFAGANRRRKNDTHCK